MEAAGVAVAKAAGAGLANALPSAVSNWRNAPVEVAEHEREVAHMQQVATLVEEMQLADAEQLRGIKSALEEADKKLKNTHSRTLLEKAKVLAGFEKEELNAVNAAAKKRVEEAFDMILIDMATRVQHIEKAIQDISVAAKPLRTLHLTGEKDVRYANVTVASATAAKEHITTALDNQAKLLDDYKTRTDVRVRAVQGSIEMGNAVL